MMEKTCIPPLIWQAIEIGKELNEIADREAEDAAIERKEENLRGWICQADAEDFDCRR
jgi:hypothetical protein